MKSQNHWFIKFVVIVAALSLVITALAPLIYLIAPQVSAPDPAEDSGVAIEELIPDILQPEEAEETTQ